MRKNNTGAKITPLYRAKLALSCLKDHLDYSGKQDIEDSKFIIMKCLKFIQSAIEDIILELEKK